MKINCFEIILLLSFMSGIAARANTAIDNCVDIIIKVRGEAKVDFINDFGFNLLQSSDPIFKEPEYLEKFSQLAVPGAANRDMAYPSRHGDALGTFNKVLSKVSQEVFPSSRIELLRFANTGTDANNYLFEQAQTYFFRRTNKKPSKGNLLFFNGIYGGGHGRVSEIAKRYEKSEVSIFDQHELDPYIKENFKVPSPQLKSFRHPTGSENERLLQVENEALEFIRRQVGRDELEIGGILIEPISVNDGVIAYRPEFMLKLRKLADELQVPIFSDEIFMGGGRTGTFWSYQQYPGFEPDLITFGKGLVASGVIHVQRSGLDGTRLQVNPKKAHNNERVYHEYFYREFDSTSLAPPATLLTSAQVMRVVGANKTLETIRNNGEYFLEKLVKKASKVGVNPSNIHGLGMIFYVEGKDILEVDSNIQKIFNYPILHFKGRIAPPLTLTKEQIDLLLD